MNLTPQSDMQNHKVAGLVQRAKARVARRADAMSAHLVRRLGVPAAWMGYRWMREETLREHLMRRSAPPSALTQIHPARRASGPLPRNIDSVDRLTENSGWFGFSFRDVPNRQVDETCIAQLEDCNILSFRDGDRGVYTPAIVFDDGYALAAKQLRYRPPHGACRTAGPVQRFDAATWFLERAFDNHSHWLTAHLPKLLLLQRLGALNAVLLPNQTPPAIERSLEMAGLPASSFVRFDETRPLHVRRLRFVSADRFARELLEPVRAALTPNPRAPGRKIMISRAQARGRRLANEADLWAALEPRGFERVFMERLPFDDQVALMSETRVLAAPHGAGLTNMVFAPSGAHIIEIKDRAYPNPNFYALACAMGHQYWMIEADASGGAAALERDLHAPVGAIVDALDRIEGDA
jgi:capsular polysaccharide biosynthesis protein